MKKNQKIAYYCKTMDDILKAIKLLAELGGRTYAGIVTQVNAFWHINPGGIICWENYLPGGYAVEQFDSNINTELDLTKILKDEDVVYCTLYGNMRILTVNQNNIELETMDGDDDLIEIGKDGRYGDNYLRRNKGEIVLFPSKTQRDWSKFVRCPFKKGELIAVSMIENPGIGEIELVYFKQMNGLLLKYLED